MQAAFTHRSNVENAILAALSERKYEHLRPHLEPIDLPSGENLFDCDGGAVRYVYFPLDAVIYLFTTLEDGATIETGIIGSEGLVRNFRCSGRTNNFEPGAGFVAKKSSANPHGDLEKGNLTRAEICII